MIRHGSSARRSRRAIVAAAAALSLGASAVVAAPGAIAGGSDGGGGGGGGGDSSGPLYENAGAPIQQRVADLLSRMTLEEKVGQMTQAERAEVVKDPTQISRLALGSLLSG